MSLRIGGAASPVAADTGAAAIVERSPAPRTAAPPLPGLSPFKGAPSQSDAPGRGRVLPPRNPETARRLHRLRRELSRISPAPSSAEQARAEIVRAMARADLSGWTVPELTDRAAVRLADGSFRITLVSHALILHPSGAFRIVDLRQDERLYFEMAGNPSGATRQNHALPRMT